MARCYFCGREFESRQGVRAHLKACDAYRNRDPQPKYRLSAPKAKNTGRPACKANLPKAEFFDPLSQVRREDDVEDARANLSSFTMDETPEEDSVDIGDRHQTLLHRSLLGDLADAQRRERIKHARAETGKRHAEGRLKGTFSLDYCEKLLALREVEEALRRELTGEEAPADAERIAEGALAPWFEKGERRKMERDQEEAEERRRKRKGALIEFGNAYALDAADEEGLSSMAKIAFCADALKEMETELDGSETEEDVEALIEDLLDDGLGDPE